MRISNQTNAQFVILLNNGVAISINPNSITESMACTKEILEKLVKSYTTDQISIILDSPMEMSEINQVPISRFYVKDEKDAVSTVIATDTAKQSSEKLETQMEGKALVGEPEYSKSSPAVSTIAESTGIEVDSDNDPLVKALSSINTQSQSSDTDADLLKSLKSEVKTEDAIKADTGIPTGYVEVSKTELRNTTRDQIKEQKWKRIDKVWYKPAN